MSYMILTVISFLTFQFAGCGSTSTNQYGKSYNDDASEAEMSANTRKSGGIIANRNASTGPIMIVASDDDTDYAPMDLLNLEGSDQLHWIFIKGGSFGMGSDDYENEKPIHQIFLPDYEMLETEVTVGAYRECVLDNVCIGLKTTGGIWADCNWSYEDRNDHPMNCVDWYQADEFCRWAGGKLPSEAQWEYAAGLQKKTLDYSRRYRAPDCTDVITAENGKGCNRDSTWPVCSKQVGHTTLELCDMIGNVSEWIEDTWHDNYHDAPSDGSAWLSDGDEMRVLRGGSWQLNVPDMMRVSFRREFPEDVADIGIGFRCVR